MRTILDVLKDNEKFLQYILISLDIITIIMRFPFKLWIQIRNSIPYFTYFIDIWTFNFTCLFKYAYSILKPLFMYNRIKYHLFCYCMKWHMKIEHECKKSIKKKDMILIYFHFFNGENLFPVQSQRQMLTNGILLT